jgi:N-methylhydantoinase B
MIVSVCCSGAGYGEPLERDPEAVAADVLERYISRERAESVYAVIVDEHGALDRGATEKLRAKRARSLNELGRNAEAAERK